MTDDSSVPTFTDPSAVSILLTSIWKFLPTSRHHAYVCSAGSLGYHALKELLQNGIPGNTILLESNDIRESCLRSEGCCLVYTFPTTNRDNLFYYRKHIPRSVSHIILFSNMRTLPALFLRECEFIQTLDMSALPPMQKDVSVPFFLGGCGQLTTIDLSPLSGLMSVGPSFLEDCKGLTSLDLGSLSKLTKIDCNFLGGCSGLTTLDLSPLSNVTAVYGFFLSSCEGLKTLDLSPLSKLTKIDNRFMKGCTGLTSLDLSPLSNVSEIGLQFLAGCTRLETLDMTPLSQLTTIQSHFLCGCSGLKNVLDLSALSSLQNIGDYFLDDSSVGLVHPPPGRAPPTGWLSESKQWKQA